MAKGRFSAVLPITLKHEGGFVNHPRDPGGATNKGITIGTFRQYRPGATVADLRAISDADVEMIYRKGYWNPVSGDFLPAGVDLSVFDYAVNSGVSRASRALQSVVGVKQDGKIGPNTLSSTVVAGGDVVIKRLSAQRMGFLRGLKIWDTFGRGWTRRVADVEARSMAMWLEAKKLPVAARMKDEAQMARKSSQAAGGGAVGAGGGAASVPVIDASAGWEIWAVVAALVVVGVLLAARSRIQAVRAKAYEVAA